MAIIIMMGEVMKLRGKTGAVMKRILKGGLFDIVAPKRTIDQRKHVPRDIIVRLENGRK